MMFENVKIKAQCGHVLNKDERLTWTDGPDGRSYCPRCEAPSDAEPQATAEREYRHKVRDDILARGPDYIISQSFVLACIREADRAEDALVSEQVVGVSMAADVLRMSASLGKKIEEVTELKAQAARYREHLVAARKVIHGTLCQEEADCYPVCDEAGAALEEPRHAQ